ncbi:DUF2505 domain-containing protein [Pseudactinotalea sp. HY158]|uniref:DUF2505 domain-containing protein n=1 Tax=Pseudactinotalea sp. HY158 TaxID=2654547 RepID=UPI00129CBAC8|nr:DUF2505 domain-containing protein [Pseudactinotalea sp. HY158]QGH70245.1 DUF2505 family protein [Pseudactinotalea sp. HY158]
MRFDATITYPAPADRVAAMLADPEYVRRKVAASGATNPSQDITGDAGGDFTVSTTRTMPADLIPERYRKFVPGGVTMTFVETWSVPASDGARTGTLTLTIAGAPAKAAGTSTLRPTGQGCELSYTGDVKVRLPIVGASIESAAVRAVERAMSVEREVGLEWLGEA